MTGGGYYSYRLSVSLRAPFVLAASGRQAFGVDISQIRDPDGCVVIPGTHIRGVLHHAWDWLGADGPLGRDRLFGRSGTADGAEAELVPSGLLWFTDLKLKSDVSGVCQSVTRVSIDDATGTAADGHLIAIEQIADIGETVEFEGHCTTFLHDPAHATELREQLELALSSVSSLGRFKTVGYGRVVEYHVGPPERIADALGPASAAKGRRLMLRFTPDRPFLVDISRPDMNTLQGASIIPGGVLKGALARKFALAGLAPDRKPLASVLSRLRIGHAFPEANGIRSASDNLDAVANEKVIPIRHDKYRVTKFASEANLPAFRRDWKEKWRNEWHRMGWSPTAVEMTTETRTHVAISREKNAAEDGKLFTSTTVVPIINGKAVAEWCAEIYWPGETSGPEYDLLLQCLGQFESGLFTLGKTNATIRGTIDMRTGPSPIKQTNFYRVELLTAANLLLAEHLDDSKDYERAIDNYWRIASQGNLQLARLDRDGNLVSASAPAACEPAMYLQHSYRNDYLVRWHAQSRSPLVLTTPGSVFLLEATDRKAAADRLSGLIETGLPIAVWKGTDPDLSEPVSYRDNPFVPENGYGAISVEALSDDR